MRPLHEERVAVLLASGRVLAEKGDHEEGISDHDHSDAEDVVDKEETKKGSGGAAIVVDGEEALVPKVAGRPYTPTKKEREEHEATDLPYRAWCKHCVYGKGVHSPHFGGGHEETGRATVSLDYCFMGEEASDDLPPILVMWDNKSGMLWALPVDNEGAVNYVVRWCSEKLERAGYGGVAITLKSDGEERFVALKRSIALRRAAETMPIEAPVRESKSNGAIEKAVQTWQGQFRTIKSRLEDNLKMKVTMDHPLVG